MLTNTLNQDCLKNLFSVIRGRGGHRDNPTPQQFRAAFRQIVIQQLFQQSERSNCKIDFDKVLLDVDSIRKKPEVIAQKKIVESITMPDDVCDIIKSICDSSDIMSTTCIYSRISLKNEHAKLSVVRIKIVVFKCTKKVTQIKIFYLVKNIKKQAP